jgi:hypothetical protein
MKHLVATGCLIHPHTILTRNWFMEKAKKQVARATRKLKISDRS